jgi:hypothetical protein
LFSDGVDEVWHPALGGRGRNNGEPRSAIIDAYR